MTDGRARVEKLALEHRHGVIERREAMAAGMTRPQVDRRLQRGQWIRLGPQGWYALAEKAACPLARLVAATRALTGPAWGGSALALIDLGPHPDPPMVASDLRYTGPGVRRVHVVDLAELPRTTVHGIDTVTPAVAVVAAGRWHRNELELHLLIDEAVRRGLTSWREVDRVLRRFPRMGRGGSTRMRKVLEDHLVDPALPLSDWGRRFVVGLVDAGLPRPLMEHRVLGPGGGLVAQVDAAYPAVRYAIELDSRAHHLNEQAFEVDRRRDANLARLGWLVRRFTWKQWEYHRPWVLATIKVDLADRGAP